MQKHNKILNKQLNIHIFHNREEETHEATDKEAKSWFKGILLMKYSFLSVLYAYYNL